MILKQPVYEEKMQKMNVQVSDYVYGCDFCEKVIDRNKNDSSLEYTIFNHDENNETRIFCSWKCVIERLKTEECGYFISLPYISYDNRTEGQRPEDLLALFK